MYWILLVCANLFGSDASRLGADSWVIREDADRRLRLYGLLALPAVSRLACSSDPEIRFRVAGILGHWQSFAADLRAAAILCDPWPLGWRGALSLWHDERTRLRVRRVAMANGVGASVVESLQADEEFSPFFWGAPKWVYAAGALQTARKQLGTAAGWPFR